MDSVQKEHYIYNYDDTLFCVCITDMADRICESMVDEHMLTYIISGEMLLLQKNKVIHALHAGDVMLIKRNHLIRKIKQPANGKPFKGLFFKIKAPFLKALKKREHIVIPSRPDKALISQPYIKVEPDAFLGGFFSSLENYFDAGRYPSKALMDVKMQEAVVALMDINPDLGAVLFDFEEPWRTDIASFMNSNFLCDMSLEDFAHYTGRSLSTFKRDFAQAFGNVTPARWIMTRRLQTAKKMIEDGEHPADIYLKVGFKNLSHFSTAFKKQFGMAPTMLTSN